MEDIRSFFVELPAEGEHEFDSKITHFVNSRNITDDVIDIIKLLVKDTDAKVKYAAFYCLILYYRNEKNKAAIESMFENHGDAFSAHPTFKHLRLLCRLKLMQFEEPSEMLNESQMSIKYGANAGISHLFADITATLIENELLHEDRDKWVLIALNACNRAILLESV